MTVASPHKKRPCAACMFTRKGCAWRSEDAKECNNCLTKGIQCLRSSDVNVTELYIIENGDKELQNWRAVIDQLDRDMNRLDTYKADLERTLAERPPPPQPEWRLSITNGKLQLETPLRSSEELSMFTQASIRYLSPFSGLFKKQPVRFESTSISIPLGLLAVIQRRESVKPVKKRIDSFHRKYSSDAVKLSTHDHRAFIDQLIMLYLEHFNPYMGLLHRQTFLDHYHSLDDPMDDALTLAVCIQALFTFLHRLRYTPYETRIFAEMFYTRCKILLFDMCDEPTKKLDIVVITSLIQSYVSEILLDHLEANRLATIALLFCADLAKYSEKMTPIQWITFQRNHFKIQMFCRTNAAFYENKIELLVPPITMHDLTILDDEPEITKKSIYLINQIFHLLGSHYISSLLQNVSSTFYGQPCDIFIEDILRYEPMVKSWWDNLPIFSRLCDDPFDPDGYKLVEGKVSGYLLAPFIIIHIVTGLIMSSMLRPNIMGRSNSSAVSETMQVVRSKIASLALTSCKVIVYALNKNWDPSSSGVAYFGLYITRFGIYCLEKLSSCEDIEFPSELLSMLKKRLETKSKSLIPVDHQVPASSSLFTYYHENPERSPFEIYQQYSLPGLALYSDTFFSCLNQLADQHLTAKPY